MNIDLKTNLSTGKASIMFNNDSVITEIDFNQDEELNSIIENLIYACAYFINTDDHNNNREINFSFKGPFDVGKEESITYKFKIESIKNLTMRISVENTIFNSLTQMSYGPYSVTGAYSNFDLNTFVKFVIEVSKKANDSSIEHNSYLNLLNDYINKEEK